MYEDVPVKALRPNDMCTASYYGDVAKLKELLTVPEVEEEPPLPEDFDPSAHQEDEELDPQEIEEAKERSEQRAKNAETIQKLLSATDVLTTRLSPVDVRRYGLHLFVVESGFHCVSRFKTSAKSSLTATPLHWAVLGRSHAAIEFLVSQGADIHALCPVLGVSPVDIATVNKSFETLKVLHMAKAKYDESVQAKADSVAAKEKMIADHAEAVKEYRRREEEEERLAAEREAAEMDGVADEELAADEEEDEDQ